jgi:hypothetical protein
MKRVAATLFSLYRDPYSLIDAMVLDAARDGVPIDPCQS